MSNANFVPAAPSNISIRPLTAGITVDLPPSGMPPGAANDLLNYDVFSYGIRKRGGFTDVGSYSLVKGLPQRGNLTDAVRRSALRATDLENITPILVGDRWLYTLLNGAQTRVTRQTAPMGLDSAKVNYTFHKSGSTYWFTPPVDPALNDIFNGDAVIVTISGNDYIFKIVNVATGNVYVYDLSPLSVLAAIADGTVFQGYADRTFATDETHLPQIANVYGEIYLVDSSARSLLKLNSSINVLNVALSGTAPSLVNISCVSFFGSYLWLGNFTEGGTRKYTTIRWSDYGIPESFSVGNFFTFDETSEMVAIVGMGTMLVVYFGASIYYGVPANITNVPYVFRKLDTPNIGAVGPNAIVPFLDGHFFIGPDDVYYFSQNQALQPLNAPMRRKFLSEDTKKRLPYAQLSVDPNYGRMLLLIPGADKTSDEVWIYNINTKAWSRWNFDQPVTGFGTFSETTIFRFVDWTYQIGQEHRTFQEMLPSLHKRALYAFYRDPVTINPKIKVYNHDLPRCGLANAFPFPSNWKVIYETPDFDFDQPDRNKFLNRTNLKITLDGIGSTWLSVTPLTFKVELSSNRGRTWKNVGNMVIQQNEDEAKTNLSFTGSLLRLRFTLVNTALLTADGITYTIDGSQENYTILETGIRFRIGGVETRYN